MQISCQSCVHFDFALLLVYMIQIINLFKNSSLHEQTDRQTDRQTDEWTDRSRQTDLWMDKTDCLRSWLMHNWGIFFSMLYSISRKFGRREHTNLVGFESLLPFFQACCFSFFLLHLLLFLSLLLNPFLFFI